LQGFFFSLDRSWVGVSDKLNKKVGMSEGENPTESTKV
jgi:hypothetical protein